MSAEKALEYIKKILKGKDLSDKIEDSLVDKIMAEAKNSGLSFSKEDFHDAWKKLKEKQGPSLKNQLSDEQLDKVSGGKPGGDIVHSIDVDLNPLGRK